MPRLAIIVTALCALAATTPARALGDLKNCNAIADTNERMTCLYSHIAHLEQTLLSLSTDITDLRHALRDKLDAKGVYKLQYVGKGNCLTYAERDRPPALASCDRPDSWKLVRGSQSPPKGSVVKTTPSDESGRSGDKDRARDRQKKASPDETAGKSKEKSKRKSKEQPQADSQPKATPVVPAEPQAN
jgi:hypothetical protein